MPLALVTGAGIRLGRAIAIELARAGHDLVLCAHASSAQVEETAREVRALGRAAHIELADLSIGAEVDALAARVTQRFPALDVVVHNAAIFEQVPFAQVTRAQYERMQKINLEAPFFLTQGLLPAIRTASAPVIVHIVDNAAERPMNRYSHYMLSKAGVAMLTKALAVELGPHVRVCGVAPGAVAFPESWSEEQKQQILKRVPLQRAGSPDDIARAVRFLVENDYLSGVILPVDGGRQAVF